jgi:hypothetical protein
MYACTDMDIYVYIHVCLIEGGRKGRSNVYSNHHLPDYCSHGEVE